MSAKIQPHHNVHESLLSFLVPIKDLTPLPNNPRKGDINAIAASYKEFGQLRPILFVEEDGDKTIVAGNHQYFAAKDKLKWTHIAAMDSSLEPQKAIAFALADNRTSELGTTDEDILYEHLIGVAGDMPEFFEELGWSDFDIAAMEPAIPTPEDELPPNQGWEPPVILSDTEEDEEGELHYTGDDEKDVVLQGSDGLSSAPKKAIVQYTIVFDDPAQQTRWYHFLRWMKERPDDYAGTTTAAQLHAFLGEHAFEGD